MAGISCDFLHVSVCWRADGAALPFYLPVPGRRLVSLVLGRMVVMLAYVVGVWRHLCVIDRV